MRGTERVSKDHSGMLKYSPGNHMWAQGLFDSFE
jgi:hypothetical protein